LPRLILRYPQSANAKEETLSEYICDWPDCPNVAEHVLGSIRELRAFVAVCGEHVRLPNPQASQASHDLQVKDRRD
jgi:hypothetical protein